MRHSLDNSMFPLCLDYAKLQNQIHWMPEEIVLTDDVTLFTNAPKDVKTIVTNLFKIFTELDIQVGDAYTGWLHEIFYKFFPQSDLKDLRAMFVAFANMENIHAEAYASLITTLNFPDSTFKDWRNVNIMRELCLSVNEQPELDNEFDLAVALGKYIVNHEGLTLFLLFSILYALAEDGYFKNAHKIVTFSIRDESLHVIGMTYVFRTLVKLAKFSEVQQSEIIERVTTSAYKRIQKLLSLINTIFENVNHTYLAPTIRGCFENQKVYLEWLLNLRLSQLKNTTFKEQCPLDFLKNVILSNGTIRLQNTDFLSEVNPNYSRPSSSLDITKLRK